MTESKNLSVLVSGDDFLLREGASALLNHAPDLHAVGKAETRDTYRACRDLTPDVVLIDLAPPSQVVAAEQIKVIYQITTEIPDTAVLALTPYVDSDGLNFADRAKMAGASAVLDSVRLEPDVLFSAIRQAALGLDPEGCISGLRRKEVS